MSSSTAIILSNDLISQSSDRALLEIYGQKFIELVYHKVRPIFKKTIVVVDDVSKVSEYQKYIDTDILVDEKEGKGSVSCLLTGLNVCKTKYAFAVGIDQPLLNQKVIEKIIELTENEKNKEFNAHVPEHDSGQKEFMHASYKVKPAIRAIENAFKDEKYSFQELFYYMSNVNSLPMKTFQDIDPQLHSFFSVNSEVDFLIAKERLAKHSFQNRLSKAEKIKTGIIKDLETESTCYYKVPGTDEFHEVIFYKRKGRWNCDCTHFAMKGTYCSHILAAQKQEGIDVN